MPQDLRNASDDYLKRLRYVNKRVKEYTKEGQVDPDVRAQQKKYYRGDAGMKPLNPSVSNPGDQQLRDLYEGSGKYYGYGKTALEGSKPSYPNQSKMSKALGVKNTKAGM
jgi:hypothetical protein